MRFLTAALALLLVGVASAIPSDLHSTYTGFLPGRNKYEVTLNVTGRVPGMHDQSSKFAYSMDLYVHARPNNILVITAENVKVSKSLANVEHKADYVTMEIDTKLQEYMKEPIIAIYKDGKVQSYSLADKESTESKRLKVAILRLFDIGLDGEALKSGIHSEESITYNKTRASPVGNYVSHYFITSSPYADFPKDQNVVNVTRTDNYENIPYLGYTHHNYEEQGCPGVCKKDRIENRLGAGCPAGYEPYQGPIIKAFVHYSNLRQVNGKHIIDKIESVETHSAKVFDQNMVMTTIWIVKYNHTDSKTIKEPTGLTRHSNLYEWNFEALEREIDEVCKYTTSEESVRIVQDILKDITDIVLQGSIDDASKSVGEKLVRLQKASSLLTLADFDKIQQSIVSYKELPEASEHEKIKRQIWLENLPLIGSDESISFIVKLIKKTVEEKRIKVISLWESKSILEALPMNILRPNGKTIQVLSELLEVIHEHKDHGSRSSTHSKLFDIFSSSVHIAIARVVRNLCAVDNGIPAAEKNIKANHLQMLLRETDEDYRSTRCPKIEAKKFITHVVEKYKEATERSKRIPLVEAMCLTGMRSVLPMMKSIVAGHGIEGTPSIVDYERTVAIHALHNFVTIHPKEIIDILLPIFANQTEPPKVRTACFSVIIRCNPSLGNLQYIVSQTWHELSQEVGNYVTSTLETFGNSTIPCHQQTAHRIKKVLPQAKRFSFGKQHAQNIQRTHFDAYRGLGLEGRYEYTPSNESYIPSTMYSSIGYNADSLRDTIFKIAMSSQGFNSRNLWDSIRTLLKMKVAEHIPKSKESQILPEIEIADRANEFWRFTLFNKMFYSMSYYHLDEQEFENGDLTPIISQLINDILKIEEKGDISGHLVKIWIPSSYKSRTLPHSLSYPVGFEMKHPMLFSLKLKIKHTETGYSAQVLPSFYHSILYKNELLNVGDCKHIGVYHETKWAATYPFESTLELKQDKYDFSYSFPELPKKIFTYHSEAGTYARKHALESQHSNLEKKAFNTTKELFKRKSKVGLGILPVFRFEALSEDMQLGYEDFERSGEPLVYQVAKKLLNPGWRRKSVNISREPDDHMWGEKSRVTLSVSYNETHIEKERSNNDDSWMKNISIDDHDENKSISDEHTINDQIRQVSSHHHEIRITVKQHKPDGKVSDTIHVLAACNHTLENNIYVCHVNSTAKVQGISFKTVVKAGALFYNRPNEFQYAEDGYGKQRGIVILSLRFGDSDIPSSIAKVVFSHKPLGLHINKDLQVHVPEHYFYPETHEQCIQDVQKGESQSVACVKAIGDRAKYNSVDFRIFFREDLPIVARDVLEKLDLAVKHTYFPHLSIEKRESQKNSLRINALFIDKWTDRTVAEVTVTKPDEKFKLHKIDPGFILPMSSIDSVWKTYVKHHTDDRYPADCALMKESIRTFDSKTISLPRHKSCSYVLAAHCVDYKKFVITVKYDPKSPDTKVVYVYAGKHLVVLKPGTDNKYEIEYDQKPYTVKYLKPLMLHEKDQIYAVNTRLSTTQSSILELHLKRAGIRVKYTGTEAVVEVNPRYKGELCGLCSEFDGEVYREKIGPNKCLYSHDYDFAASCAIGKCYNATGEHESICPGHDYHHKNAEDHDDKDHEYKPKLKRNRVLPKGDKLCFSVKAYPVCNKDDEPVTTEIKKVGFHCRRSIDNGARKSVTESNRRILGEYETKEVDIEEDIEVPTICTKH